MNFSRCFYTTKKFGLHIKEAIAAVKSGSIGKIRSLFSRSLALGKEALPDTKDVSDFLKTLKRLGSALETPIPSTEGGIKLDMLIVLLSFVIGWYLLSFVIFVLLGNLYEWSHASFRLFFNFFNAIWIFPDYPLDQVKMDDMVYTASYITEALIGLALYKWLKRKYFKK